MSTTTSTAVSRYIYAFTRAADIDRIMAQPRQGLFDADVTADVFGELAVLSSPIEARTIRPRRQLLAAHQGIVTEVSKCWDMLPVSFGLIAADAEELARIVTANADQLLQVLDRVQGKVEMNLVLKWAAEDIFQYFVRQHASLQQARDAIAGGQASRDDMIEMGRMFETLLNQARDAHAETVQSGLADACSEIELQDPKDEKEIVRVNCLIPREGEADFEAAVHRVATNFNDDFAFAYNGPWPPYSFVNLKLIAE